MIYGVLGLLIVLSPFVGIFIFIWKREGISVALFVYGLTASIVASIGLGTYFMKLAGWLK